MLVNFLFHELGLAKGRVNAQASELVSMRDVDEDAGLEGVRMKSLKLGFLVVLLGLVVAGCRIVVTPGNVSVGTSLRFGIELSSVIQVFEPTRGAGSGYRVGDSISFRILTNRTGYITLSAIDPDGTVYVFARNIYVRGGETTTISGADSRTIFTLQPPRGLHRVRAAFTPSATGAAITYTNVYGEDNWTRIVVNDVRPYEVRDIVETRFFLD
jgi:hypothetical protein